MTITRTVECFEGNVEETSETRDEGMIMGFSERIDIILNGTEQNSLSILMCQTTTSAFMFL